MIAGMLSLTCAHAMAATFVYVSNADDGDISSYVLSPDLVSDQRQVSLRWTGLPGQLPRFLDTWLESLGYSFGMCSVLLIIRLPERTNIRTSGCSSQEPTFQTPP